MIRVRLNDVLGQRQLSQRELARRTKTHPDVISRFARQATSGVSYDLLSRICSDLGCAPGELLEFVRDPPVQMPLFDEPTNARAVDQELMKAGKNRGARRKVDRSPRGRT